MTMRSSGVSFAVFWLFLGIGSARAACPQLPPPPATADFQGFKGRIFEQGGQSMPYRLFVPDNYDPNKAYPLVLYLHHAGLIGTDNCIQLTEEIGSGGYGGVFVHQATDANKVKFTTQSKYPHFLVAPQATNSSYGFGGGVAGSATAQEHPTHALIYGILAALAKEFNIDARRRYVTGISMGCYGTWDLVMRKPEYFAAASPQSCRGDPNQDLLKALVHEPIWSMCGTADSYFAGAQAMSDAMNQVGAQEFVFTPFPGVGHSIHDLGYDYPGFIDWMFAQALPEAAMPPGAGGSGGGGGNGGVAGASPLGGSPQTAGAEAGGTGASLGGAAGAPPAGMSSSPAAGSVGLASGGLAGTNSENVAPTATDSAGCAFVSGTAHQADWQLLWLTAPLLLLSRRRRRVC
jgi:Putative esterase